MNPFGVRNANTNLETQAASPAADFDRRRSELHPEVRGHVDRLYAELRGLYAKYSVKSVRELHEKAVKGEVSLKIADTRRIDALVDAIKKALETNKLEGFERLLTVPPSQPYEVWDACDGHIYLQHRSKKTGETAVLMDGKRLIYQGHISSAKIEDGRLFINENSNQGSVNISRVGPKKRFGFEKTTLYAGPADSWVVSGGRLFLIDRTRGPMSVFVAKRHKVVGLDETEDVYRDGGDMIGEPQFDDGHVYTQEMIRDRNGEYAILRDGQPWKTYTGKVNSWFVRGGKLFLISRGEDGKAVYVEHGEEQEDRPGARYGNHYYRVERGAGNTTQIIQDGQEVIVENAISFRFNSDALYVQTANPEGGATFIKITGEY